MRILTGTDIIEIKRVQESMESIGENFQNKIFTPNEIAYCESKRNAKYQHYAGRFASKEAIYKAVSDLLEDKFEIDWQDVEVLNDLNGKPYIVWKNDKWANEIESADISISHCKEYATANVMILCKSK